MTSGQGADAVRIAELFARASPEAVERTLPWVLFALSSGEKTSTLESALVAKLSHRMAATGTEALVQHLERAPPDEALLARIIEQMLPYRSDRFEFGANDDAFPTGAQFTAEGSDHG